MGDSVITIKQISIILYPIIICKYKKKLYVHWHVRPRYDHPVILEEVAFEDPEFGYHYIHNRVKLVPPQMQEKIIEKIRGGHYCYKEPILKW